MFTYKIKLRLALNGVWMTPDDILEKKKECIHAFSLGWIKASVVTIFI